MDFFHRRDIVINFMWGSICASASAVRAISADRGQLKIAPEGATAVSAAEVQAIRTACDQTALAPILAPQLDLCRGGPTPRPTQQQTDLFKQYPEFVQVMPTNRPRQKAATTIKI